MSAVLLMTSSHLFAQTEDVSNSNANEYKTVFNSLHIDRISGFGGAIYSVTNFCGETTSMSNAFGGVILNNALIGVYEESTNYRVPYNENSMPTLDHSGLYLGYELHHRNIIHPVFSVKVGGGDILAYSSEWNKRVSDHIFSVTPSVAAEINFTRFFKMNAGAEYRLVSNVDLSMYDSSDFSGFGAFVSLVFGWF